MRTRILNGMMAIITVLAMGTATAHAFSSNKFTSESRLANGHWMKIAVPADGIYQITREELASNGFSDLENIQVYGHGGHIIGEVLDGNFIDDLQPVATMVTDDKVIFYAQGPVTETMMNNTSTYPYYTHKVNGYANYGYYFITDNGNTNPVAQQTPTTPGSNVVTSSYSLFRHEAELTSVGYTGKQLLGESLMPDGVTFDYRLPQICDNSIVVHLGAAAYVTNQVVYASAEIVGQGTVSYTTTENKIRAVSSTDVQRHYNTTYPARSFQLTDLNEEGQIHVSIYNPWDASIRSAQLDFVDLTYKRKNSFDNDESSFAMGLAMTNANTCVMMPETDDATIVWDVTDPQNIRQMALSHSTNEQGDTVGMSFTPGARSLPSKFYAFKPEEELPSVTIVGDVENQNVHGLDTPDMLIVTNDYFWPEAERLAQMHRDHDGMKVHVVDQEQVFNEFSSGTPDASAIRLLCKMLYDRNPNKFKFLLMFGPASYDYRGITTDKANRVITYETDNGESDQYSYGTDDFFGMLADNSGTNLTTSDLMLGVGRLTPTDLNQAKQNVDKIMQYILTPDYGPWRNHYTVWADNGDNDLHQLQGQRIDDIIQDKQHIPMVADKTFIDMFPKEGNVSTEARRHVIDILNAGQYYGTYMGHANPKSLTSSRMWTTSNIRNQSYDHQPIFMTACCDVARFDSNDQGIAEIMFHQPNGGAIAVLTASREVDAKSNDYLNQAFTEAMFSYNTTGQMTTLGQAYMKSKRAPITNASDTSRYNKMAFILLGDPAIKVLYPKPLFNITTINGVNISATDTPIELSPMQQVTVEADVLQAGSTQVNTTFNGDATLSVYDCEKLLKHGSYSSSYTTISGDIYFPRDLLVEVQGRVENGHFVGTAVIPRYIKAKQDEQLAIHVYAHQDNSTNMVNGMTTKVVAKTYDEQVAVQDDAAPIIELMYLNEQATFEQGGTVPENSILHVTATDDVAFNNQSMGVGCTATLRLDNGATNYTNIKNFVSISDGGKMLQLDFPVNGLTPGQHSLTFNVQDVAGNVTEHSIYFMVGGQSTITLKNADLVAIEEATIDLDETELTNVPAMTLKVVNARGELVWSANTAALPYTWDLTNNQGERVAPGLYKLFGQYNDGASYGGTNIMPIIVMDPVKQ